MGDGGGVDDGGAARRAAEEDARKQAARKAVNQIFGYGAAEPDTQRNIVERRAVAVQPSVGRQTDDSPPAKRRYVDPDSRGDPDLEPVSEMQDVITGYETIKGYDPSSTRAAREAQIKGIAQSNFDLNKAALDEQRTEAARNLKFALSRAGQRGGSLDVAKAAQLQNRYQDQVRAASAGADEIGANLRTADEEARLRLLGQVEAGADQSALLAGAGDTLRANVDRANAAAKGNIITNAFSDIGSVLKNAADRRATKEAERRAGMLFGNPAAGYQGSYQR